MTGKHSSIIVPPSWIVKLPRKGSFKSSLRKPVKKKSSSKKKNKEKVNLLSSYFYFEITCIVNVFIYLDGKKKEKHKRNEINMKKLTSSVYFLFFVDSRKLSQWGRLRENHNQTLRDCISQLEVL